MDIFQFFGDTLHAIAILMLLLKILATKNVSGLSYKTQQLFVVVCLCRYYDIIFVWRSFYLFFMKLLFITSTIYIIYLMRLKRPFYLSYDKLNDKFPHWVCYLGAAILTLFIHPEWSVGQLLWSFSIWLEALSSLPQLLMIGTLKDLENITAHYVLFLAFYRIFYIFHWCFHWQYVLMTSFTAGILQTIIFADFIYYFYRANQNEQVIAFPV